MKKKTWRIIYPDKTESIYNYDPELFMYCKALEDFAQRIGKCKTAWKIKEHSSYIRTDWLIKWLKKLKKEFGKGLVE